MPLTPGDVPEQVVTAALAVYLNRPGDILLSEDYGEPFARMRDALSLVLNHPDAQTVQSETQYSRGYENGRRHGQDTSRPSLGQILSDTTPTPADLRADPDLRVDAAYQRGVHFGRSLAEPAVPIEAALGSFVDDEVRDAHLATLAAQKRHAEAGAEAVLDQTDMARRAFEQLQDAKRLEDADRERLWAASVTPKYVLYRDALYAAIAHADARTRSKRAGAVDDLTDRDRILEQVPWWAERLAALAAEPESSGAPAGTESAAALEFTDALIGFAGARLNVDSIHDSTTPGVFRAVLTDDTEVQVEVTEVTSAG